MAKKRMNGEGSWTQRDNGTWKLSVSYKGIGRKYFYGDKQTCLQKKLEFESLLNKGIVGEKDIIFKHFIESWLKTVKKPTVKQHTYDNLEFVVKQYIIKPIGDLELKQIDGHLIQTLIINKLKEDGYSYQTVRHVYSQLGSIFKYAALRGKVNTNPMAEVILPKKTLFQNKETRYLSENERKALVDTCYMRNKNGSFFFKNGPFYVFIMYTGCRIGEAMALKWSDIDLDNRTVTIGRTMITVRNTDNHTSTRRDQNSTKNGITRTVYLSDMALQALLDIKATHKYDPNGYILPGTHTDKPITYVTAHGAFKRIIKQAGIEDCSIHSLRHTFVSLMINNNIPIPLVADMVGHTNINTTMKVYTHLLKETQRKSMEVIKNLR
jgi:integrase